MMWIGRHQACWTGIWAPGGTAPVNARKPQRLPAFRPPRYTHTGRILLGMQVQLTEFARDVGRWRRVLNKQRGSAPRPRPPQSTFCPEQITAGHRLCMH